MAPAMQISARHGTWQERLFIDVLTAQPVHRDDNAENCQQYAEPRTENIPDPA